MTFLYAWRKFPMPLSMQEFLEVHGQPRPVSKHILRIAAALDRRLGENS